jgi:hypothetical protein
MVACGSMPRGKVDPGEPGTTVRFSTVLYCDEVENSGWCLNTDKVVPGEMITILVEEKSSFCHARAKAYREIDTSIALYRGMELTNIDCEELTEGSVAVIAEQVKSYKNLNFTEIKDTASVLRVDREIRERGLLNRFEEITNAGNNNLIVYQYPHPYLTVYFANYDPQPLIMIIDGDYKLLSHNDECVGSILRKAFALNNRYYAMLLSCVCETDNCGEAFVQIQ